MEREEEGGGRLHVARGSRRGYLAAWPLPSPCVPSDGSLGAGVPAVAPTPGAPGPGEPGGSGEVGPGVPAGELWGVPAGEAVTEAFLPQDSQQSLL